MTIDQKHLTDDQVDRLLEDLRISVADQDGAQMDDGFMARLMSDAAAQMPRRAPVEPGIWAGLLSVIGGWGALGGLTTAGVVGIWLGMAPPDMINNLLSDLNGGVTTISIYPESDLLGLGG